MWNFGRRKPRAMHEDVPPAVSSRNAARTRKKEEAWGEPWWLPLAALLMRGLVAVSLIVLIVITAFFAVRMVRPDLTAPIEALGPDLQDNFTNSVVFFWLEAIAIATLLKAYDGIVDRLQKRKLFHNSFKLLANSISNLHDIRYNFAVALDTSKNAISTYDVTYMNVNVKIHRVRAHVTSEAICNPGMTDHSRFLIDRLLRELDVMVAQTHVLASECQKRSQEVTEERTGGEVDGEAESRPASFGPDPVLEGLIEKLFTAIDPDHGSIGELPSQVEDGSVELRFRKSPARRSTARRALREPTPSEFWSHERLQRETESRGQAALLSTGVD
jgi:hypothetical protein